MSLAAKLQIKPGSTVATLAVPSDVELGLPDDAQEATEPANANTVIAFALNSAALDSLAARAISAALEDRLAWIAYPKAGKLGTDLNRDVLARMAADRGVQPVRQVAIDDTWSALRFRPAR